jgi:Lysine methyltransferase
MEIKVIDLLAKYDRSPQSYPFQEQPILNGKYMIKKIIPQNNSKRTDAASDRIKGVYEGGGKTWECTYDLLAYLDKNLNQIEVTLFSRNHGVKIMELGCGSALVSCYLDQVLLGRASFRSLQFVLQDYNATVIENISFPNIYINAPFYASSFMASLFKFFAGDWHILLDSLKSNGPYDLILGSELLYDPDSYTSLLTLIQSCLVTQGLCLLATKSYYFGVDGGTFAFCEAVKKFDKLSCSVEAWVTEGVKRDIIVLKKM